MKIELSNRFFLFRKRLLMTVMRTTIFLFCATVFAITPKNAVSQNSKINIKEKTSNNLLANNQQYQVSGTITDQNGQPLPGATVLEKNTKTATSTDFDGKFSLNISGQNTTLVISFVGFLTQEIYVNGQANLNVTLIEDIASLDEVVIVGYGAVKKSDLTGAVGTMKAKEIAKQPVTRVDQAIQGRISGVQVTTTSGAPGAGATIRIRGGNSISAGNEPLYVIDGFIGGGDLNTINPNDIESIEVLKDAASTAIYGSRGSNGVILITTKRGTGNRGFGVSFDTYTGIQSPVRKLDMLNGPEFAAFSNEASEVLGTEVVYPDVNAVANTDWQDVGFQSAIINSNNLSFYNNTENSNYFASLNYFNQEGIQIGSSYKRYQLRFNFDQKLGKNIKLGASINIAYSDRENPRANIFGSGVLPTAPLYNDDGSFFSTNQKNGGVFNNPLAQDQLQKDNTLTNRGLGNIYAQFTPLEGLDIKSTFGFDFNSSKRNSYTSVNYPGNFQANRGGNASINIGLERSIQNENTINYHKEIENHSFDILGGWTYQKYDLEQLGVNAYGFTNDVTEYNAIETGDPTQLNANSGKTDWTLLSGLYRLNYSFNNKYLLTLSGRHDGSSRLSKGNKWQFFPSAAVGWKVSKESFLIDSESISNLKLRASYGKTGSQSIDPYATLARLNTGTNYIGGVEVVSVNPGLAASPDLTWEVTSQIDIGLELGLFNNRLNFEIDYYKKNTDDLLLARELAFQTGFETRLENVGSIENQGIDLSINGFIINNSDFSWSSTLTLSSNKNEVLQLSRDVDYIENGIGSRIIEGAPVGIFYGPKFIGLWQTDDAALGAHLPGEPKFEDLNGDGTIDANDGQIIGNPNPDFYGGWNNVLTYKNFTFSAFFDFSVGNDIYDLDGGDYLTGHTTGAYGRLRDRWTPENTNTNIPRAGTGAFILLWESYTSMNAGVGNSFFISDGSYLRLKNINIQYKINAFKNTFKSLSIYGSATNVLTFTSYKGFSPDVNSEGTNATRRGFDKNGYPQAKVFLLGIKAEF
jgi:TonB-linked SusC/RagA family outer membrane protein